LIDWWSSTVPSKSGKQHRLMALVANDPKAAKRLGIPQKVGEEFMKADKGRKFGSGGSMKESKAMMKKEVSFMKKKGAPASMIKHEEAEYGMKRGGKVKKMAGGGSTGSFRRVADGIASKGKTKGKMVRMYGGGMCK
jgi:hypothetical protein